MRPAEEIAREMVADPELDGDVWRCQVADDEDYVPLEPQPDEGSALALADEAVMLLVRLIERSRAEGSRAQREADLRVLRSKAAWRDAEGSPLELADAIDAAPLEGNSSH